MIRIDRARACYYALVAFVILAFLIGGSGRSDVLSLIALRPMSMLVLAFAVAMMPRESWRANRPLVLVAVAGPLLAVLHLVPLPPAIWQSLPGRDIVVRIDDAVGLAGIWRPLSLVPYQTVNSLFYFAGVIAALLLAISIDRGRQSSLMFVVVGLASVSAVLGLLQSLGGANNPLYFYQITNRETGVGLFANRNHNAVLLACLLPIMAGALSQIKVTAEQLRWSQWVGASCGLAVLPFIVATQSRAGLALAPIGMALAWWSYQTAHGHMARRVKPKIDFRIVFGAAAATTLMLLTLLISQTGVLDRLATTGSEDELRFRVWPYILRLCVDYLPLGTGLGTFVEVWSIHEPYGQLRPTYLNHAHNDMLEIVLTGGLPGAAIALAGIALLVCRFRGVHTADAEDRAVRRAGLSVLGILAIGSIYEYPLRTPSLSVLAVLAVVWYAGRSADETRADPIGRSRKT